MHRSGEYNDHTHVLISQFQQLLHFDMLISYILPPSTFVLKYVPGTSLVVQW